jgi:membrane associated rhomboid family serine protease
VVNAAAFALQAWMVVPLTLDLIGVIRSAFLHQAALPFAINVLFLWLFGDNVEDQTGRGRFVLLYMLSGVASTVTQLAIHPGSVGALVGASGAIGGVIGAYFVLYPRSRILLLVPLPLSLHELPVLFFLAFWALLQFLTLAARAGVPPQAADVAPGLAAHAVAFAAGALLCLLLRRRERSRVDWWSLDSW